MLLIYVSQMTNWTNYTKLILVTIASLTIASPKIPEEILSMDMSSQCRSKKGYKSLLTCFLAMFLIIWGWQCQVSLLFFPGLTPGIPCCAAKRRSGCP